MAPVSRLGAVEVYQAIAVVNGQSKEIQEGQAEKTGNFRSEAAALVPHIKCGHTKIFLAESSKLEKQIAGLIHVRDLTVDSADSGLGVTIYLADLRGHFVRNEGFCRSGIQDKENFARVVDAGRDQQQVTEAKNGHKISHVRRDNPVVEFFVGGLVTGKRIEAQLPRGKIQRKQELGEYVRSDEAIGGADRVQT